MERKGCSRLKCLAVSSLAITFMTSFTLGCAKSTKLSLKDTEGRSFTATCKDRECDIDGSEPAAPSAPKPDDATAAFVLHRASRIYAVCEVWRQGASHAINPADCRALACERDQDCPPANGLLEGACTNHLCIEPTGAIATEDAVLMCLAGTGKPSGSTKQVERYALGNACSEPCQVPAVCRQP
jgi:hypothetical protein